MPLFFPCSDSRITWIIPNRAISAADGCLDRVTRLLSCSLSSIVRRGECPSVGTEFSLYSQRISYDEQRGTVSVARVSLLR